MPCRQDRQTERYSICDGHSRCYCPTCAGCGNITDECDCYRYCSNCGEEKDSSFCCTKEKVVKSSSIHWHCPQCKATKVSECNMICGRYDSGRGFIY